MSSLSTGIIQQGKWFFLIDLHASPLGEFSSYAEAFAFQTRVALLEGELMTLDEASEALSIHPNTLSSWAHQALITRREDGLFETKVIERFKKKIFEGEKN